MSAPHTEPVDGSFDPMDKTAGHVDVASAADGSEQTLYLDAPGMNADERSTYWLTAAVEDFCDLAEMR